MPDQASSTAQETGASGLETLRLSNGYVRHVADRGWTPTVKMVCRRRPGGRSRVGGVSRGVACIALCLETLQIVQRLCTEA